MHPGDEVIVLEPCYDSYVPAIELNGGVPVVVSLRYPDYAVDWDAVRARDHAADAAADDQLAAQPDGRPCSPPTTCARWPRLVDGTDILVLSDEVYEHIIFDGLRHESMARASPRSPRAASSSDRSARPTTRPAGRSATPSRPAALTTEFRKVHQFVTFSTNTPVQYALAEFLGAGRGLRELAPFFQAQARPVPAADGRIALPPAAVARQLLPADGLLGDHRRSGRGLRGAPDHGARRRVDPDVAVPLSSSRRRTVLRFCFAKKDETLEAAAERLRGI